jgi:hypothetical protein
MLVRKTFFDCAYVSPEKIFDLPPPPPPPNVDAFATSLIRFTVMKLLYCDEVLLKYNTESNSKIACVAGV